MEMTLQPAHIRNTHCLHYMHEQLISTNFPLKQKHKHYRVSNFSKKYFGAQTYFTKVFFQMF